MLRRQLAREAGAENDIHALSYRGLIRLAAEKGLVPAPQAWFDYREARNLTSHSYNVAQAERVLQALPDFLRAAQALRDALEARHA